MKAIDFIQKFGWVDASHKNVWFHFGCSSERSFESIQGFRVFEDLKPYVDAYELVQKFGGIDGAKEYLNSSFIQYHMSAYNKIKQAISLVEEVENNNEKTKEGDPS